MARPKAPYFPLHAKDLLTDPKTACLSHDEIGVLLRLWSWMWINDVKRGSLLKERKVPISDEEISRLLHVSVDQLQKHLVKLVDQEHILKRGTYKELYSKRLRNHKTPYELRVGQKQTKNNPKADQSHQNRNIREVKRSKEKLSKVLKPISPLFLQRAEKLKNLILQNNPSAKVKDSKWGDIVRLMVERDKRTLEEIDALIEFSQGHEFEKTVVLSMGKIRDRFDSLTMKMKRDKRGRESNVCPACHKPMADQGDYWFCSDCRQKHKKAI